MKKPAAALKKMGGPVTAKGKLASSQNAIKTGLTTRHLLNEQEFTRLNQLITDLGKYYSGANPLIQLQIEKIARLHIQLERIQNAIDALYRQSEMNPLRKEKKDYSQVDLAILNLHLRIQLGIFDVSIIQKIKRALLGTKLKSILAQPLTRDHGNEDDEQRPVFTQESLLGAYLYAEANFYHQEVSDYLKDKTAAVMNSRDTKDLYQKLNIEVLNNAIDLMQSPDLEQSIITEDYYEFRQFNSWFELQLSHMLEQLNELERLIEPEAAFTKVPIPNFDDLDRFMRYQTTISRQLSTAIGELRVLAAKD